MSRCSLHAVALTGLLSFSALAQNQPSAETFIPNGSFEESYEETNFWYGLDRDGTLAANRVYLQALTPQGNIDNVSMPVSVAVGDLNADGFVDDSDFTYFAKAYDSLLCPLSP